MKKNNGFTLIELLVVVSIIGVLSSIAISSITEARKRVQDRAYMSEVRQLQNALELYYIDNGVYPAGPRFTRFSQIASDLSPYMDTLPGDRSRTITNTTSNYITEHTGDGGCLPVGVNSSSSTNGNSSYTIRYYLSQEMDDTFYRIANFSSNGVATTAYVHCARPLLK